MKKCGKKHIENRSGIACCGADYPFGPSGSFRDIVSVPELRPTCRTSGKRLAVSQCAVLPACRPAVCRFAVGCLLLPFLRAERPGSVPPYPHALCCPHVVRRFADSPWGAFCCRSCAPNVREASLRIPCAVLSACRPAVCRFAVGCLLLSFLRAERPGSVPPYPHALCCPHVVRRFADSPWGAFCCRSCAPNVREASLRIPCAVLSACRPAVCRFAVGCLLLSFLRAERPGSVPPYPHALCCPHVVCGMFLPTLPRLSGQCWGPFFRGRR